jgi:phosphate:Na+ symporter
MLRSGMMSVRQILPIIIGVNMVAGLIILVLVIDIKIAILFLLGIAGIVFTNDKTRAFKTIAGVFLGVSMLFLGLNTMQEGVAPLTQAVWFEELLQWTQGNYILGFAIGAAMSFLVQSSLAPIVLTIAFQTAGLFSLADSIMVVYGANVGSSILTLVLSSSMAGQSKQVAMYQTAYNFVGAIILLPLFYLEIHGGYPLVKSIAQWVTTSDGGQIATVNILFNFLPGVVLFGLIGPTARLYDRLWPETLEEQASKPKYIHDRAAEDPDSALDLIELEQIRLIEFLSTSLDTQREGGTPSKLLAYQEAFKTLGGIIRETISDLSTRKTLTSEIYERLDSLLNIQHHLESANDAIVGLSNEFRSLRSTSHGSRFVSSAVEGVDAIVLSLLDVAKERSEDDAMFLNSMTSEDGNGIKAVRSAYLAEESKLDTNQRMQLLAAANYCERLIWLFGNMGENYMALKA